MTEGDDAARPTTLARVLDPAALEAAGTRRARVELRLPRSWFEGPVRVRLELPRRLGCEACGGGGCGRCGNRGGFAIPAAVDRALELSLPGRAPPARLRIVPPFAAEAGFDVLLVDLAEGGPTLDASRVDVVPSGATPADAPPARGLAVALGLAIVLAAAVLAALSR